MYEAYWGLAKAPFQNVPDPHFFYLSSQHREGILHHRLASLLGSNRQAVLLVFLFSTCSGIGAIALLHAATQEAILLIVQSVLFAVVFSLLERAGNR